MKKEDLSNWADFRAFIEHANKHCNWLVLRNFEYLPDDFFENDKDVDVLCENVESFAQAMCLLKLPWGVSAYTAKIENKYVHFDVRFLGDNYYDRLWQYKMLMNKVYTELNVPRLSNEDYLYGLIYHAKLQKTTAMKDIYKERLIAIDEQSGFNLNLKENISNDTYLATILSAFMNKNKYRYEKPLDVHVPENKPFLMSLKNNLDRVKPIGLPVKYKILSKTPKVFFKIVPDAIKIILKKYFY